MKCLEEVAPHAIATPLVDVMSIDGASPVHTLDPKRSGVVVKTFHNMHSSPHCQTNCSMYTQTRCFVWDPYKAESNKPYACSQHGTETSRGLLFYMPFLAATQSLHFMDW